MESRGEEVAEEADEKAADESETPEDNIEGESLFDCVQALRKREKMKLVTPTHPPYLLQTYKVDFPVEGSG